MWLECPPDTPGLWLQSLVKTHAGINKWVGQQVDLSLSFSLFLSLLKKKTGEFGAEGQMTAQSLKPFVKSCQKSSLSSSGFHLVFLPYADDKRKVPFTEKVMANPEQIDKMKAIVQKLRFKYR